MYRPDRSGLRIGPFWFMPGLTRANIVTVNFAAFSTVSTITFISLMQPYVLTEMLHVPIERQGTLTGYLAALQEAVVIAMIGVVGAWSDRVGRRPIFLLGFLLIGVGYFFYPLAESESQLILFRVIFAAGVACASVSMSITLQDSCQEVSRSKWLAFNTMIMTSGIMFMALLLVRTPEWYVNLGVDAVAAGRLAFWTMALICLLVSVVLWVGLRDWAKSELVRRKSIFQQIADSLIDGVGKPRLAMAFGAAFVGRGDLVVLSTFLSLWVLQYGNEHGLSIASSATKAGTLFGIIQASGLVWAYFIGVISDRVDRITGLCVALILATSGYLLIGLVENPLGGAMIPAAVLVGMGEVSVLITGATVLGEETRPKNRGAVVGVFGLLGALGILFATYIGGIVFDHIGRSAPFIMMALLNFLLLIAAFSVRFKNN